MPARSRGRCPQFLHVRAVVSSLIAPNLGDGFGRLWCAAAATSLGDGVLLAAGPLLVSSVSDQPLAVGTAVAVQQLPWLMFALLSGAVVDRVDRRRLAVAVNVVRAAVLATLAAFVALRVVVLPVLYVALFLLGVGETLADNAAAALLARLVPRELLGRANARLFATLTVSNQLLGPPLGALLFVADPALPFGLYAGTFVAAAMLVAGLPLPAPQQLAMDQPTSRAPLREQVAEGLRWLWRHPGMRALAGCIAVMNVTFMAAFATWVLYAQQRLGLSQAQFGVLITAGAVGGLAGSWVYGRLERWLGRVLLVRAGLVVEALTHLILALTRSPVVAFVTMSVFGVHAVVWGTVAATVRQRAVPDVLLGRVTSVYLLASFGGAAVGSAIGGPLAQALGLAGPFWLAVAGVGLLTILAWRPLAHVDDEPTSGELVRDP